MLPATSAARGQASPSPPASGAISGTVLSDADNRPMAQVAVSVRSNFAGVYSGVLTDSSGQFVVRGIPQGPYVISIDEAGYEPLTADEQLNEPLLKVRFRLVNSQSPAKAPERNRISLHELKIPGKAQNEFRKGLQDLDKKQLEESLSHFLKATRAFSGYYEAYYHAGVVEVKLERQNEAMESFQSAINLSQGHYALAQFGMGYLLYLEGQPLEAEKVLRRGLEADPNAPNGYAILGLVLLKLNRVDEAEKCAQEALLRNPNFAGAYLVLSDVYKKKGDSQGEAVGLNRFLKLHPAGLLNDRIHARAEALTNLVVDPQN